MNFGVRNQIEQLGASARRRFGATLLTSALALAGVVVAPALGASATQSHATSTAPCALSVSAGTGTVVNSFIIGVTPGTTQLTLDCNANSGAAFAVEASLLAALNTTAVLQANEVDTSALSTFSLGAGDTKCPDPSAGCLTTTFPVPSSYAASDTNAQCPPTQAQINAGIYGCAVAVATAQAAEVAGAQWEMTFAGAPAPASPTVSAQPRTGSPSSTVDLADASSSAYWWANNSAVAQSVALGASAPSVPSTCGSGGGYGDVPTAFLKVNWFATGSTTPVAGDASGVKISNLCYDGKTVSAPQLSGSIPVPSSLTAGTYTVQVCEMNLTPLLSNDTHSATNCGTTASGATYIDASFTFTVAANVVSQNEPLAGTVSASGSAQFTSQLANSGATGSVTYSQTSGSPDLMVSSSGLVSTNGALKPGAYSAAGTTSDASGDAGTFAFSLTVTAPTTPPGPKALRIAGIATPGRVARLVVVGHGFKGRATARAFGGARASVTKVTSGRIFLRVVVKKGAHAGRDRMIVTNSGQHFHLFFKVR